MGYEQVSKAYRVYDIEAGHMVITRDITFDESTFGFSPSLPEETSNDTALDFDAMDIREGRQTEYKQTGKRKSHSNNQDHVMLLHIRILLVMELDYKKQVRHMTLISVE